jgi:shikimate kinase
VRPDSQISPEQKAALAAEAMAVVGVPARAAAGGFWRRVIPRHRPPSSFAEAGTVGCYAGSMRRVLLTGMSGTGKSTVIRALATRGYKAIDTDTDEWSEWVTVTEDDARAGMTAGPDWIWREDRIQRLLATEDAGALFVSGCKSNQGKFRAQFDHVILLHAPTPVLLERLATRTTNPYGKQPDELAQILHYIETVEPRLRRTATLEVDTSAPLEQVIATILGAVLGQRQG